MSVEDLLSRLDKVKKTSKRGTYQARCPAHADRGPSLSITQLDDGRVLLHCFAGCSVHEVVTAVGLDMSDLFPPLAVHHSKPERRPFPAADILRAISFEALTIATAGASMLSGNPFTEPDRERVMLAASRIQLALTAGGLSHE